MKNFILSLCTTMVLVGFSLADSVTIIGRCISLADADTITVRAADTNFKVRLVGIDAPEKGQEYGSQAHKALGAKLKGQELRVEVSGADKYQRMLGRVYIGDEDINLWLVRNGWAWQFVEYDKSSELAEAQFKAKEEGAGLWAGGLAPMAPWDFRDKGRQLAAIKKQRQEPSSSSKGELKYWLNTSSYSRHNEGCRYYHNTKRGRACSADEGKACGICGG